MNDSACVPFCTTFLASICTALDGAKTRQPTHRTSDLALGLLLLGLGLLLVGRNALGGDGQAIGALQLDFQGRCDR